MIRTVAQNIYGAMTMLMFLLNVILWAIPILVISIFKLLIPVPAWRLVASRWLMKCGENWISFNRGIVALTQDISWDFRGVDDLRRNEWYLVVSNHQSWLDILALQLALNRRIPFLKFFIKQQLIWIPILGQVWWAMDMPFMKRYSREYLSRNPQMRGRDLEATRKACEHFSETPTSVMNFLEGTRFTPAKHKALKSPYTYLLPPRPGGAAFVLGALGTSLHALLDVTIVYAEGRPSLWDLCIGKVSRVVVDVKQYPIESWLLPGDYQGDRSYRARFKERLGELWLAKDKRIGEIRAQEGLPAEAADAPD